MLPAGMEPNKTTSLMPKHTKTDSHSVLLKFLAATAYILHAEADQCLAAPEPSGADCNTHPYYPNVFCCCTAIISLLHYLVKCPK